MRLSLVEGNRELKEMRLADDDIGEGITSRSVTPAGVKGVRESAKCQAPSGRRIAMRMSSPGLCLYRGPFDPECGPPAPNGVICVAGWSLWINVP